MSVVVDQLANGFKKIIIMGITGVRFGRNALPEQWLMALAEREELDHSVTDPFRLET